MGSEMCIRDSVGGVVDSGLLGISSDGRRVAGYIGDFGLTWLTPDFSNLNLISNKNGFAARVAWTDGVVVYSHDGQILRWTEADGIQELPGNTNFVDQIPTGVSSDGQIIVGVSAHELVDRAAYYWDSSGTHRLNDNIAGYTTTSSGAGNISPNGNFICGHISALDSSGNSMIFASVWEGDAKTLRVLTDGDGNFIRGFVRDISDSGFAIGPSINTDNTRSFGFITEGTGEVQRLNEWILTKDPTATLANGSSLFARSVHFDGPSETLRFTADRDGTYFYVAVDLSEGNEPPMPGDVNTNGVVDFFDIQPFIDILVNQTFQTEADIDGNGVVDFFDIQPFIDILTGGG